MTMQELCDSHLVSVIIPVYDVEKYLDRCMESVLGQTYKNTEVILVDDGSPDSCPRKCDDYAAKDPRVRVIHQKNSGVAAARNTGVKAAKGDYITFVDSDDYVCPLYIEQLMRTLRDSGRRISASSYGYDDKDLTAQVINEYRVYSAEEAITEILRERDFQTSPWGKLYDSDLFVGFDYPVGKIYEDYYAGPRLFDRAGGLAYARSRTYLYRTNRDGITKSYFNKRKMQYFEIADDVNQYLAQNHPGLVSLAVSRDVNMAIGFLRKISREKGDFVPETKFLIGKIREGIGPFLKSGYPPVKKVFALGLITAPGLFMKALART